MKYTRYVYVMWTLGVASAWCAYYILEQHPTASAVLFAISLIFLWVPGMAPSHEKYSQRYQLYLHRCADYRKMNEVYPFTWREFKRHASRGIKYDIDKDIHEHDYHKL